MEQTCQRTLLCIVCLCSIFFIPFGFMYYPNLIEETTEEPEIPENIPWMCVHNLEEEYGIYRPNNKSRRYLAIEWCYNGKDYSYFLIGYHNEDYSPKNPSWRNILLKTDKDGNKVWAKNLSNSILGNRYSHFQVWNEFLVMYCEKFISIFNTCGDKVWEGEIGFYPQGLVDKHGVTISFCEENMERNWHIFQFQRNGEANTRLLGSSSHFPDIERIQDDYFVAWGNSTHFNISEWDSSRAPIWNLCFEGGLNEFYSLNESLFIVFRSGRIWETNYWGQVQKYENTTILALNTSGAIIWSRNYSGNNWRSFQGDDDLFLFNSLQDGKSQIIHGITQNTTTIIDRNHYLYCEKDKNFYTISGGSSSNGFSKYDLNGKFLGSVLCENDRDPRILNDGFVISHYNGTIQKYDFELNLFGSATLQKLRCAIQYSDTETLFCGFPLCDDNLYIFGRWDSSEPYNISLKFCKEKQDYSTWVIFGVLIVAISGYALGSRNSPRKDPESDFLIPSV